MDLMTDWINEVREKTPRFLFQQLDGGDNHYSKEC